MNAFTTTLRNPSYLRSSATFLLFFASWGIWWSFFQLWLTSPKGLGLNGAEVGTIYSINSAATLLVMLLYGTLQDRLGTKRHLTIFVSTLMVLVGPFFTFLYQPLLKTSYLFGAVVGSIYLSLAFLSGCGLFEALAERFSRRDSFEYGQCRMWGSFGYAIVALIAGFAFTINPYINFWLGSAFGVGCLIIQIFWRINPLAHLPKEPGNSNTAQSLSDPDSTDNEPKRASWNEIAGVLKVRHMWVFVGFVLLSWTFYGVFDSQMFPEFYTKLFSSLETGQRVYGILNSAQVFVEALMMGVVPIIMRKIGVRNTLLFGILVMFLRISGCAIFHDPYIISFVKMFHALEVPLCVLPVFRYFTIHFKPELSATLYMVAFQIASQIGNIILSPILGKLRDNIGFQQTFYFICAIVALAGVYGFTLLKKDDQDVNGEPFVRSRKNQHN